MTEPARGAIIDPGGEPVYVHTNYTVVVTSFPWIGGNNVNWSRRHPAHRPNVIDRGTPTYANYAAGLCNANRVNIITGFFQPGAGVDNPMPRFESSFWKASNLGELKLAHMAGIRLFPDTLSQIQTEIFRWIDNYLSNPANAPRYARVRDRSGAMRPLLFLWGATPTTSAAQSQFIGMINQIRSHAAQKA